MATTTSQEMNIKKAKQQACLHVFRHYRGTRANQPGVLFTKDHVYMDGYVRTIKLLQAQPTDEMVALLTTGRYNQFDAKQVAFAKGSIE